MRGYEHTLIPGLMLLPAACGFLLAVKRWAQVVLEDD